MKPSRVRPQIVLPVVTIAALALAVLYVILAAPVHAPPPPAALSRLTLAKKPAAVPLVAFTDAGGKHHLISEFRGRTVLLNLWATWCAPCVRELPSLAKLSRAMKGQRFSVVAVDVGRSDAAEARRFLDAHGASSLKVYVDTDIALVRAFHAYGLPLSVVIDPKGREIARAFGGSQWDAPEAIAYLKNMADGKWRVGAGE